MKPGSHSHLLAIVLCVLALLGTQVSGSRAGYICLCGGEPMPTQTSHCHGPHGEECHTADAQAGASHDEEDSGEREEHQVVSREVQLRPVEATQQVFAPQVLLAILPMVETFFVRQDVRVSARAGVDFGESPPFGVTVARTIVLLI